MTIETLMFIHNLLKNEEYKTKMCYDSARHNLAELEDSENPGKAELKFATERKDHCFQEFSKAQAALLEFMQKEWN